MTSSSENAILKAIDIQKSYDWGRVCALRGVSCELEAGQTVGVLGESGSGKSTLAKVLLHFEKPDAGWVEWKGRRVDRMNKKELVGYRQKVQMIFQEPTESLDARLTIEEILAEPLKIQFSLSGMELKKEIFRLMDQVRLPQELILRKPRTLSGGECQRVAIARALASNPEALVCDEAVASLDAVTRADILNLFLTLQRQKNIALIFITHHVTVAKHMSDKLVILKDGLVCESGISEELFRQPRQAYTRELLEPSR